ncbi:MAG: nucleotidyltransferase domain-containing protein [Chloroflexota bacterium]|nr:nucleotidyltransferase domain-containing protein [Chloroflexota bacterium]
MIPLVAEQTEEVGKLCRHYRVQRLDLFGSASVRGHLTEDSDLDFVVEFQPEAMGAYADAYFGLLEALERLFGRSVDLVIDSAIRNPYFREAVDESRTLVYAA